MRALNVYVETSVFGFLLDSTEYNRSKKEATEKLFSQFASKQLRGYVSPIVLAELMQTSNLWV